LPWPVSPDNSAIKPGVGQINTIALVADGSTIYLLVNDGIIAVIHDTSYTQGYIGLVAFSEKGTTKTEVAYRNLKVWVDE
jgi:hypothetical protein